MEFGGLGWGRGLPSLAVTVVLRSGDERTESVDTVVAPAFDLQIWNYERERRKSVSAEVSQEKMNWALYWNWEASYTQYALQIYYVHNHVVNSKLI